MIGMSIERLVQPSIAEPTPGREATMDILVTLVIILIICLAVAPFFLLSGEFRGKSTAKDDGTGLVTPVPGTGDGPVFPKKPADSDADIDGGDDDEDPDATDDTP